MEQQEYSENWLDRPVFKSFPKFSREKLFICIIILLAVLSRFVMVGVRVMSHDEVNHVVPAWNLYKGSGYAHDPVTHGPFQFHMLALSYFLLGDNDFSSRVPAALFSIAAIVFILFAYRRYLGRIGTLVAGALFLISPFILFYGRYTRNEAFIELFAVMTFYAFLRYYEQRDDKSLYLLAVVSALQFTTKEVAYIYCAQLLLFCGFIFLRDLWKMPWKTRREQDNCAVYLLGSVLLLMLALSINLFTQPSSIEEVQQASLSWPVIVIAALGVAGLLFSVFMIVRALSWKEIRRSAAFNLIVFLGALILPQLSAFVIKLLGFDPLDYSSDGILRSGIVLAVFIIISFLIGCWWNRKVFLKSAAAFYLIFIFFYTTVFSNGQGFFTGIIGSLGYWLSQQNVQRGGQPLYYYSLILLPVYEFAAIAGTLLAIGIAAKHRKFWSRAGDLLSAPDEEADGLVTENLTDGVDDTEVLPESVVIEEEAVEEVEVPTHGKLPTLALFVYWSVSALIAYSIAGEKMPWLSVHIAIPLALSAAWGIGYLLERISWKKLITWNGLVSILCLFTAIFALCGIIGSLNAAIPPFADKTLGGLKATSNFTFSVLVFLTSMIILIRIWRDWTKGEALKTLILCLMSVLLVLQARTAFTASFINYNQANELMVYAHAAPGPKVVLDQIGEVASRTGQGKAIKVAYDNDALYPYWWYFRDYTNKNYFGEGNPTRELRNYDVIILNSSKDGRMEPIVKEEYYRYEYIRLWWPNQDYFNLTPQRVFNALTNPEMRSALFKIWLNRDYRKYATVTGKSNLTSETWDPSARMTVYMKKDLLRKMWLLGDEQLLIEPEVDPFEEDEKFSQLDPEISFGNSGVGKAQFKAPRALALSPDAETVYVLDTENNRVQYFSKDGTYGGEWNAAEVNGFNQPWGIATGPDGSVYIADTWNHRMLKFSADGEFLLAWYAESGANGTQFYGPRSVAVSTDGKVYVSDTGNKRIMIYDENGIFINKFGTSGMGPGEFDEAVGIALLDNDRLAVADTWNQRVQIIDVSGEYPTFAQLASFDVQAWYSQSLDNKPYITADSDGRIFISDPEGYLIFEYGLDGNLVRSWNAAGGDIDHVSMPTGLTLAADGSLWVVDTLGSKVNKFVIPEN